MCGGNSVGKSQSLSSLIQSSADDSLHSQVKDLGVLESDSESVFTVIRTTDDNV